MNPDAMYRNANSSKYRYAVANAKIIIRNAVMEYGDKDIAVAVSGGKDSTAMAHLVCQFCKPILLWNDSGLELPESEGVVTKLADMLKCRLIIAKGDAETVWKQQNEGHKVNIDERSLFGPSQKAIKEHGIKMEFVGLREDEAKVRKRLLKMRGSIFYNKRWGCITAFPMRKWKSADCLAYIDEHGLPLHPAYLRTEWQEREKIRVSWVYDDNFESSGSSEYCRKYYPEIFRRLREKGIIR